MSSRLVDGFLSEHFDIEIEEETAVQGVLVVGIVQEENAGLKNCDDIQATVTEQMCVNTVICMSSYSICIHTISQSHENSLRYYCKHM